MRVKEGSKGITFEKQTAHSCIGTRFEVTKKGRSAPLVGPAGDKLKADAKLGKGRLLECRVTGGVIGLGKTQ